MEGILSPEGVEVVCNRVRNRFCLTDLSKDWRGNDRRNVIVEFLGALGR
jgi:hypothetical protein